MADVRLIDANALDVIRFTPTGGELLDATERGWNGCISFLQTKAKTIDAVPVVRCRECKEYEVDCGYCDYWEVSRNFDDYCSRGVKKMDAKDMDVPAKDDKED